MGVEPVQPVLVHVSDEIGSEEKSNSLFKEKETAEKMNKEIANFGLEEPKKGGANTVVVNGANLPKDVVDEWPAPKQVHSFYFVKYRSYDDQQLKAKSDQADRDLQRLNSNRLQITEKLRAKRADRAGLIDQLKTLGGENRQYQDIMNEKRRKMEPLQQALGKLRNPNGVGPDRGFGLCSSEEELNNLIKSLEYRMAHESIPLTEEKKILREIKQLQGTREKVIANAQMRAEIQDSLGEKDVIQSQVKHLGVDMDGVRKEQQVVKAKRKQLEDEKFAIEKQIDALQEELADVTEKRNKAYEKVTELRKQREQGNSCFFQNRMLLNKARDLASKKDIGALKELAETEVDTFMSMWSSTKAFRDDYEKRIIASLDIRQLSRDGRMRNPNEKPLVLMDPPVISEPEVAKEPKTKEPKAKEPKEESVTVQKVPTEKNSKQQKEESIKVTDTEKDTDGIPGLRKEEEKVAPEVDEAKVKEMKREEEIAKAKLALERKKKLAEKAAAKAAIKAQKEAEKKLKEREKRAKKKAAAGSTSAVLAPEEQTEPVSQEVDVAAETEMADENIETDLVQTKNNKQRKENQMRNRIRPKGQDSLSKIILKRKKSRNQWVLWAAPTAFLLLVLVVVGYYYLL